MVSLNKATTVVPAVAGNCYYCGEPAIATVTMSYPRAGKIRRMERPACAYHVSKQLDDDHIRLLSAFRRAIDGTAASASRKMASSTPRGYSGAAAIKARSSGSGRNSRAPGACLAFRQEGRGRPQADALCLVCRIPHHLHPHE